MIEPFEDIAPSVSGLTEYDRTHIKFYMRVHDAHEDGADWKEAVHIISVSIRGRSPIEQNKFMTAISPVPAG